VSTLFSFLFVHLVTPPVRRPLGTTTAISDIMKEETPPAAAAAAAAAATCVRLRRRLCTDFRVRNMLLTEPRKKKQ
jgi:hypothetical protein